MSTHPWDTWAQEHGLSTYAQRGERDAPMYQCQAGDCIGKDWMSGADMVAHLHTVHGGVSPAHVAVISERFLDGPRLHAIERVLDWGGVQVIERRRMG